MPDVYPDSVHDRENALAPGDGAIVASVSSASREYGPDRLYLHGPQRARPPLVRLIEPNENAPPAPTPAVARCRWPSAAAARAGASRAACPEKEKSRRTHQFAEQLPRVAVEPFGDDRRLDAIRATLR